MLYYRNMKHSKETRGFSSDSHVSGSGSGSGSGTTPPSVVFFNLSFSSFSVTFTGTRVPDFRTGLLSLTFRSCPSSPLIAGDLDLRAGGSRRTTFDGTIFRWRCAVVVFLEGSWIFLSVEGIADLLAGGGGPMRRSLLLARSTEDVVVGCFLGTVLAGGRFFTLWVTSPSSSIPVPVSPLLRSVANDVVVAVEKLSLQVYISDETSEAFSSIGFLVNRTTPFPDLNSCTGWRICWLSPVVFVGVELEGGGFLEMVGVSERTSFTVSSSGGGGPPRSLESTCWW